MVVCGITSSENEGAKITNYVIALRPAKPVSSSA